LRSSIQCGARSSLIAIVIASLLNFSSLAASEKPLGMVVASQHARLDNANAVAGVDVYGGDTFATDEGGSLRLKLGGSQVYLLASSSAKFLQQEDKVRATVGRGTLGFSTARPNEIEIETPLATVRGVNGERVYGQVTLTAADKMTVTAFTGTLLVSANDQAQIVKPGQSYSVSLAPEAAGGQVPQSTRTSSSINKTKLAFILVVSGIAAATAVAVWMENTESCSSLPCP
jgi:hypothetical protein